MALQGSFFLIPRPTSYRAIIQSSAIIGSASALNVIFSLVKMKVAAVLLGPAGVGLIGLLSNVMGAGSALAGMGVAAAGNRNVARGVTGVTGLESWQTRWACRILTLLLALAGAWLFWLLRVPLATHILSDAQQAGLLGWLAIGVFFTVAAGSQAAVLGGRRRIKDQAWISVISGFLSAVIGVAAVMRWGQGSVLAFVLVTPLATWFLGWFFVARLPRPSREEPSSRALGKEMRELIKVGSGFMVAGLALLLAQLVVRSLVLNKLGADALGWFQASWGISMTYLGFVLAAMAKDYYPRLTGLIEDRSAAIQTVNEQAEVALLLAAPILVAMMGLAPWVIRLLYSDAFAPAGEILRWQLFGDLLKVASWPLGFILLALGRTWLFMAKEFSVAALFVLASWALLPDFGVPATGMAFLLLYGLNILLVIWLARHLIGFTWNQATLRVLGLALAALLGTAAAASFNEMLAAATGTLLSLILALLAYRRLRAAFTASDGVVKGV